MTTDGMWNNASGSPTGSSVRHRQLLPARGSVVGHEADARRQWQREPGRVHARWQDPTQRLQRIRLREALQLPVVGVPDHGLALVHDERPSPDPHEGVAAVSGAALHALEDECQPVLEPQRGRDGRERVGAQLDGGDPAAGCRWVGAERVPGPWCHRCDHGVPSTMSMSRSTASR